MHIVVEPHSTEPPFEQVRRQIAAQAADGTLTPGTRLPTVRGLADELGLATNTVARAYRELEADRVVVTEGRRGTSIAARPASAEIEDHARRLVEAARRDGLSVAEATRLIERCWHEAGDGA